ncbi:hypothetical protein ACWEG1_05625 [Streptomyces bauhiniae]
MPPLPRFAIVQKTVSEGRFPALVVVHDDEGDWLVGDDTHDPNETGASHLVHLAHVLAHDPSLAALADLPLGHVATRHSAGDPWIIGTWSYEEEE